jgi:hypothetical protein
MPKKSPKPRKKKQPLSGRQLLDQTWVVYSYEGERNGETKTQHGVSVCHDDGTTADDKNHRCVGTFTGSASEQEAHINAEIAVLGKRALAWMLNVLDSEKAAKEGIALAQEREDIVKGAKAIRRKRAK